MEVLLTGMKPIAVMGQAGAGRSTVIRDMCFNNLYLFATGVFIEHVGCSYRMNAEVLKEIFERNVEVAYDQTENEMFDEADSDRPVSDHDAKESVFASGDEDEEGGEDSEKDSIKTDLTGRKEKEVRRTLIPMKPIGRGDNKLLFYIEDLHLCSFD